MQIAWTKCTDKLPPSCGKTELYIYRDLRETRRLNIADRSHLSLLTYPENYEWTPYTNELWCQLTDIAKWTLSDQLNYQRMTNPKHLNCSSCARFTRWNDIDGCLSLNESYFCDRYKDKH